MLAHVHLRRTEHLLSSDPRQLLLPGKQVMFKWQVVLGLFKQYLLAIDQSYKLFEDHLHDLTSCACIELPWIICCRCAWDLATKWHSFLNVVALTQSIHMTVQCLLAMLQRAEQMKKVSTYVLMKCTHSNYHSYNPIIFSEECKTIKWEYYLNGHLECNCTQSCRYSTLLRLSICLICRLYLYVIFAEKHSIWIVYLVQSGH